MTASTVRAISSGSSGCQTGQSRRPTRIRLVGSRKITPLVLAQRKQRPQRDDRRLALVAAQCLGVGEDIVVGDLPQMVVAGRPRQQRRADGAQIAPDGGLVAGAGARAAVAQGARPPLGLRADAWGKAVELGHQPLLEAGGPVVAAGCPSPARTSMVWAMLAPRSRSTRWKSEVRISSPSDVVGQQHDQVAVQGATPHGGVEAAGFGHGVGQMQRPGQPRVVRGWTAGAGRRGRSGSAADLVEQRQLRARPGGAGPWRGGGWLGRSALDAAAARDRCWGRRGGGSCRRRTAGGSRTCWRGRRASGVRGPRSVAPGPPGTSTAGSSPA